MKMRWLLLQLLLVFVAQSGAGVVHCPLTCTCEADSSLLQSGECNFGNSTATILNTIIFRNIIITIKCTNAVENFQYDCNDWPQFNISGSFKLILMIMDECAPSAVQCAAKMYTPNVKIKGFVVTRAAGSYTAEDLAVLKHVDTFKMHFRDEDTQIPANISHHLLELETFEIHGGNLQLSSDVFNLSKLENLVLDGNNIRNIPPKIFNGLPNLKTLKFVSTSIEHLDANSLKGLDSLTELVIANGTLTTIESNAFSYLKQLTTLHIINNTLKIVPNGMLSDLGNLQEVGIADNRVEMVLDTRAFANLSRIIPMLVIMNSKLRYLPEHLLSGSTHVDKLFFRNNSIQYIPPKTFTSMAGLGYLDLKGNEIHTLADASFSDMKGLVSVDLGYNNISTLTGQMFTHSPDLRLVFINNNVLTHIDRDIFNGTNLYILSLASNKLQRIIGNTKLEWRTKQLNLSHNELCEFEDWFVELADLQNLDLSGNKIEMIKASHIYHLNKTVTIDLRNNSITGIVHDISVPLVNVTPGNVTLYLSNNPLQCDCVVTTLLKEWHKYGILADYEDITCDNEDKISNLTVYIQCNKAHALVALVGSTAVGTLIIVVILLSIFTQRKKIWENVRNLYEAHYFRRRIKSNDVNDTFKMSQKVKLYDLFISFAQQDSEFVTNQLLPILENDLKLKICVNYRDTIVDDLYHVQIKESVESSTMTMIILTEYFLESEWSSPEFRTAHDLDIEDGKSNVILILINEYINRHDKLCSELKALIYMKNYLIWDNSFFWDKLQNILSKHGINRLNV